MFLSNGPWSGSQLPKVVVTVSEIVSMLFSPTWLSILCPVESMKLGAGEGGGAERVGQDCEWQSCTIDNASPNLQKTRDDYSQRYL